MTLEQNTFLLLVALSSSRFRSTPLKRIVELLLTGGHGAGLVGVGRSAALRTEISSPAFCIADAWGDKLYIPHLTKLKAHEQYL